MLIITIPVEFRFLRGSPDQLIDHDGQNHCDDQGEDVEDNYFIRVGY